LNHIEIHLGVIYYSRLLLGDTVPKNIFNNEVGDFVQRASLQGGTDCHPNFRDACETQKVCEAVIDSAKSRSWKDTGVEWVDK
jgi:hypothetical protein